jgi:pSer/pThr/pTyr-binding forkhead associated (FHA) protein
MIRLVISDNEGTTTVVPLVRDEVSIGRKEGNTIRLTERNISREHCRIQRSNGSFSIRDLGSYNGVVLNGQRIDGESPIKPGDEIRVGDYTLLLEPEKAATTDKPEAEPTPAVARRSTPPPRLVVLNAPSAGAEFTLPERGELTLGRAPELDITLDHRSVSREHAKIACDRADVRITDSGSVNGVVVNREKVSEARLQPGDIIELGDVVVRFVGAGEHYVFDPADARAYGPRSERNKPRWAAAAIVGGALVLGAIIVRSGTKTPPPEPTSVVTNVAEAAQPAPAPAAAAAAVTAPAAPPISHFADLLDSCRKAIEGGRFAEAVAHATAALKERPDAADALACQERARVDHEQEQIYVRGRAAQQAGDNDGAWKELSTLNPTSPVRERPEVAATVAAVARARLQQGQSALRKEPETASAVAHSLLETPGLPEVIDSQAGALAQKADAAIAKAASKAESHAKTASRAQSSSHAAAAAPAVAAPGHPAASSAGSPMEAASACLTRGDNQCVIRALNGRAQSAQELGLLIETYRAVGDSTQAYRNMTVYVQRFPTARRAEAYRQMLERQGL